MLFLAPAFALSFTAEAGERTSEASKAVSVSETASVDQFCGGDGKLAFLPEAVEWHGQPELHGWAKDQRIVVSKTRNGVDVVITPPSSIKDKRAAVMNLTRFFAVGARACPPHAKVLDVLSATVQGLAIVTDEAGNADFVYRP